MTVTQYIGARYVPIFGRLNEDSNEWDNSNSYEPLTVVLYQGNSYTSRQFVPSGIDITDNDYWAKTGNYNAQIEQYRQEARQSQAEIELNAAAITAETERAKAAEEANTAAITAETERAKAAEEANTAAITANSDTIKKNRDFRNVGGNGALVLVPTMLVADAVFEENTITRSLADNTISFNVRLKNNGTEIASRTYLFNIPNYNGRYSSTLMYGTSTVYNSDYTIASFGGVSIAANGDVRTTVAIPASGYAVMQFTSPTVACLDSMMNAKLFPEELAANICDYFLNGETGWEGELNYSTGSGRLTPETSGGTDCSGLFYSAYNHFDIHPINSVQASYAVNGMPIAFAPIGEPLDVTNALPGDAVLYQNPSSNEYDQQSWSHCCLYAGNNTVYEMAQTYPDGAGGEDGKGPFAIQIGADVYRMDTRNRIIVRFL